MDRHFAGVGDGPCGGLEDGHQEIEGVPLEGRCGNALLQRIVPQTDKLQLTVGSFNAQEGNIIELM